MRSFNKTVTVFESIISLGRLFSRALISILVTAQTSLTIASWAFPLAWSEYYQLQLE